MQTHDKLIKQRRQRGSVYERLENLFIFYFFFIIRQSPIHGDKLIKQE